MKLTFLGTGTSQGVPVIACHCAVCTSTDVHNSRLRTSALLETDQGKNILFDIGPDFRQQMLDLWRSVSMPLDKMKVTSEYGMRFHPIYHRSMAHNGIDFSAPTGTKVYAMLDGVIKRIGYDKRSGNFVIIDHGDYTVSYCHLSKVLVQVGERVKAGQITCLAGNTGASTGSHLHYGVRDKNGKWCNPKVMLDMVDKTRKTVLELIRQHGGLDA